MNTVKNPDSYYEEFSIREALLISLKRDESIEMVSDIFINRKDYMEREEIVRGFIKLNFINMSSYKRSIGLFKDNFLSSETYNTCLNHVAIIIQGMEILNHKSFYQAFINFGHSHGLIEFNFESLLYEKKVCYTKNKKNNDFQYYDIHTDQPVDFCNPFLYLNP